MLCISQDIRLIISRHLFYCVQLSTARSLDRSFARSLLADDTDMASLIYRPNCVPFILACGTPPRRVNVTEYNAADSFNVDRFDFSISPQFFFEQC
jgi:hypothetical protein